MNSEKILHALGEIDEMYIEEAAPAKQSIKRKVWMLPAVAACLALVVLGGALHFGTSKTIDMPEEQPPTVTYEEDIPSDIRNQFPVNAVTTHFSNIMGYDGYRICVEENMDGNYSWGYYIEQNGELTCIAKMYGYQIDGCEPESFIVDVDGDGVNELICNTVYVTGIRRVWLYRIANGRIEVGSIDQDYYWKEHGIHLYHPACIEETYEPDSDVFRIRYTAENGTVSEFTVEGFDWFVYDTFLP